MRNTIWVPSLDGVFPNHWSCYHCVRNNPTASFMYLDEHGIAKHIWDIHTTLSQGVSA